MELMSGTAIESLVHVIAEVRGVAGGEHKSIFQETYAQEKKVKEPRVPFPKSRIEIEFVVVKTRDRAKVDNKVGVACQLECVGMAQTTGFC